MVDNNIGTAKEQYDMFDKAFTTDLKNFKNPKSLYTYFKLYYDMYTEGKSGIQLSDVITKNAEVNEKFDSESQRLAKTKNTLLAKTDAEEELSSKEKKTERIANTNIKAIGIFSKNTEALVEKVATCENKGA